eukprot:3356570-Amphidinium_carterae.2
MVISSTGILTKRIRMASKTCQAIRQPVHTILLYSCCVMHLSCCLLTVAPHFQSEHETVQQRRCPHHRCCWAVWISYSPHAASKQFVTIPLQGCTQLAMVLGAACEGAKQNLIQLGPDLTLQHQESLVKIRHWSDAIDSIHEIRSALGAP